MVFVFLKLKKNVLQFSQRYFQVCYEKNSNPGKSDGTDQIILSVCKSETFTKIGSHGVLKNRWTKIGNYKNLSKFISKIQLVVTDPDSNFKFKKYEFDKVFDQHTSNEQIYEGLILDQMDLILQGLNFKRYFQNFQTGAGKSHTVFGSEFQRRDGLAYHIAGTLIGIQTQKKIFVSFFEIYNEKLRDLLGTEVPTIVDSGVDRVTLQNVASFQIDCLEDFYDALDRGRQNRKTSETSHNQLSSRSHAIIQITVLINDENSPASSKIMIVDLAGSERCSVHAARDVLRLQEGSNINKSLLALATCLKLLTQQTNNPNQFIPYRDSKLTRLLKSSLIGSTQTTMIACVAPTWLTYGETVNTLGYAQRARRITGVSVKNTTTFFAEKFIVEEQRIKPQSQQVRQRVNIQSPQRKNFIELNKRSVQRKQCKTHSPQMKRIVAEKPIMNMSFINNTNVSENNNSIMEIIKEIDVTSKDISQYQIRSLSCEREKLKQFKSNLRELYRAVNGRKEDRKMQIGEPLAQDINNVMDQYKLNRWSLQENDLQMIKNIQDFVCSIYNRQRNNRYWSPGFRLRK